MFLRRCVGIPRGAHLDDRCVDSVGDDVAMGAYETMSAALMLGATWGILPLIA